MSDETLNCANKPPAAAIDTDTLRAMAGRILAVDGIDGAGKTTLVAALANHLRTRVAEEDPGPGLRVETFREPGGTYYGEKIRAVLLGSSPSAVAGDEDLRPSTEALLFMAARAQLVRQKVEPALLVDSIVLCDRWASTTFAYQGGAGGLSWTQLTELYDIAAPFGWGRPDPLVLLDLPVDLGLERARGRGAPNRLDLKARSFYESAREAYLRFADEYRNRTVVVDAAGTPNQTFDRVLSALVAYHRNR